MDYKQSGVDIESGDAAVRRIKNIARATFTPGVLSEIGSFGGMFRFPSSSYTDPILVSSADGVGTKLKVAFMSGIHDTVGADLVNHCVNDILVHGAEPMFFLDYLATGRLDPEVAAQIVSGMGRACSENGCALIGEQGGGQRPRNDGRQIEYRKAGQRTGHDGSAEAAHRIDRRPRFLAGEDLFADRLHAPRRVFLIFRRDWRDLL